MLWVQSVFTATLVKRTARNVELQASHSNCLLQSMQIVFKEGKKADVSEMCVHGRRCVRTVCSVSKAFFSH